MIYSFGDGVQYPVLNIHLPENNHVIGSGGIGGNAGNTTAYYESMGHSVALNIEKDLNAIGDDDDDDDNDGIESVQLDNGLSKTKSISNVSTKASTGALLANESDDNLSLASSTRQSQTVINITPNSNKNNNNDNISCPNGTIVTDTQIV